ncbi:Transcription elongation factor SPT5, partial [Geodia barretti]
QLAGIVCSSRVQSSARLNSPFRSTKFLVLVPLDFLIVSLCSPCFLGSSNQFLHQSSPVSQPCAMSDSEEESVPSGDEEEEEEDEEEELLEEYEKAKKPRNQFIYEEAEETDEEEEEDEWETGAETLLKETRNRTSTYDSHEDDASKQRQLDMKRIWSEESEESIEEYYKKKYASTPTIGIDEMENQPREIQQQRLLPGVKDPNLWMVKCRIGTEKETVITLMKKFIQMQFGDSPLQIKSVVAKEGIKGYVYIEAFKQQHVKQAIEDIRNLSMGKWQQLMVPIREMTDVLRVFKDDAALKRGSWVRIKRGMYRDDIAQVDYVDKSRNQVALKMLPRVDYSRKRGALKGTEDATRKRKRGRPPAKLFDQEAIK